MTGKDAEDIFLTVVKSNVEMLSNGILSEMYTSGFRIKHSDWSDEEIRQQAVNYFYFELSKKITSHFQNKF